MTRYFSHRVAFIKNNLLALAVGLLGFACLIGVGPLSGGHASAFSGTTVYVNGSTGNDANCDGTVPDSYPGSGTGLACAKATIQAGIDTAGYGDNVSVAAGTYNENLTIAKSVNLVGPKANVDANTGSRGSGEAVIAGGSGFTVKPESADITINGFTVTANNDGEAIYNVGPDALNVDNLTISNNIVTGGLRALTVESDGANVSITNNRLQGYTHDITFPDNILSNLQINNNVLMEPTTEDYAVQMGPSGTGPIYGFQFEDNTVYGSNNIGSNVMDGTFTGNHFYQGAASDLELQIALHSTSVVSGNVFDGGSNGSGCFQLFGSQFGLVPSEHVTVSGNTFTNCGSASSPTFAIQLSQDIHDITITGNTIDHAYDGINTRLGDGWDFTGQNIQIFNNDITNSVHYGASNTVSGTMDANRNWWGSASDPSTQVNGDITVAPWCEQSACTSYISTQPLHLSATGGVATTPNEPTTITGSTPYGNVSATFPADTTITASNTAWDGTVNPPAVVSYSVPGNNTTYLAVSMGSDTYTLSFNKGVRIVLPGQAGKRVGFLAPGGSFTDIGSVCADDTQAVGDALAGGACKIDVGGNLVVWTKHFTTFATYTTNSGGQGGGGSSSSGTPSATTGATSSKPKTVFVATSSSAPFGGEEAAAPTTTTTPATTPSETSTSSNGNSTVNKKPAHKRFLGLGWWWLPIVAVVLAGLYLLNHYVDGTSKKA